MRVPEAQLLHIFGEGDGVFFFCWVFFFCIELPEILALETGSLVRRLQGGSAELLEWCGRKRAIRVDEWM